MCVCVGDGAVGETVMDGGFGLQYEVVIPYLGRPHQRFIQEVKQDTDTTAFHHISIISLSKQLKTFDHLELHITLQSSPNLQDSNLCVSELKTRKSLCGDQTLNMVMAKNITWFKNIQPNQFGQWSVCQSCVEAKAVNKQEDSLWENNTGVYLSEIPYFQEKAPHFQ